MARERGSGKTPPRLVEMLKAEVSQKSILAVSKSTGLGLAAIGRYLKGIGEPTTATLQKLADYFGGMYTVSWLRGEPGENSSPGWARVSIADYSKLMAGVVKLYSVIPEDSKETVDSLAASLLSTAEDVLEHHTTNVSAEDLEKTKKLAAEIYRLMGWPEENHAWPRLLDK